MYINKILIYLIFFLQDNVTFSLDNNQLYEAPLYFQINSTTGIVSIKQSLLNDKNLVENYKVIYIFLFVFAHHSKNVTYLTI